MKIEIEFKSPDTPPDHTDTVIISTKHDIDSGFYDGEDWYWHCGGMVLVPVTAWAEYPDTFIKKLEP